MDLRKRRSKANRLNFPNDSGIITMQSALNENLITYYIENKEKSDALESFFTIAFELILAKIEHHRQKWSGVSVNIVIDMLYENAITQSEAERNFKSKNANIFENTDIEQVIHDAIDKIAREMDEYQGKGSGFTLKEIQGIALNIAKHNPLKAACTIPIPLWIKKTNSCDHGSYNEGNDCFRQAILASVPPGRQYDFSCLTFPTEMRDIEKFEHRNKIAVHIFALDEEEKIYPCAPSNTQYDEYIDILLLCNDEHNHFLRIFSLERLIRKQLTLCHESIAICRRCFSHFDNREKTKEEKLAEHTLYCKSKAQKAIMPTKINNILKFNNVQNHIRVPFVAYCDLESLLVPINTCNPASDTSFTNRFQSHEIMSFGLYIKSDVHVDGESGEFNTPIIYTGPDAAYKLIELLINIGTKIKRMYSLNKSVIMNLCDLKKHENAIVCYLCSKPFNDNDRKVIDHDHLTGQYRGPSHNSCNLAAKQPDFLPIFFHNGSGYDYKFLVRELGKFPGEITVIPNTEERYISFSKKINCEQGHLWLRFLDSCRFLLSSLDNVSKTLLPHQFSIIPKRYSGKKLDLLMKKGQMPYEYMTDWNKLDENKLPNRECFYSSLTESGISDSDYQHAMDVWSEFNIKSLKEYMELYLETDVLLLAEVFECFRLEFLHSEYKLDPVRYYSIPGLSFDGMLKITDVHLELLTDYEMQLLIEGGIRGGFTQVSLKHAVTDNVNQLCYIDANNLYGLASCQLLPHSEFTWIDPASLNLAVADPNGEYGYIAEVDIKIPNHLHNYFNEFPPLPEMTKPPGSKYEKLVASLHNKTRYVIHYRLLQFVLSHGCELTKIHRVIKFRQSTWLAPFIQINTDKRKRAVSDFAKDLYKVLNNANYGKSIERVRKRVDLRLVNNWRKAEKLIARPNFERFSIIAEDLVSVIMGKTKIFFNKPIYSGFVILEEAKLTMLKFHYDVMLRYYGPERLKLTYTDTDSFIYLIQTNGSDWRLEAFHELGEHFDFSNLPVNHPCYSINNKKVLGKMKDEMEGDKINELVALRSKMYSIKREDKLDIKKAKGIKKVAIKKRLNFDDYKRVLFDDRTMMTSFNTIRSFRQRLYTVTINKISLSAYDDKRFALPDKISTMAHGHYLISEIKDDTM